MQRKVVFVDDEKDLCEMYSELFNSSTIEVKSFYDVNEAIEYINNNEVSIAFIDYRMPQMNGSELRKNIPQNIPCIMLTGELMSNPEQGFLDVLNKPIKDEEFEDILDNYCPNSKEES